MHRGGGVGSVGVVKTAPEHHRHVRPLRGGAYHLLRLLLATVAVLCAAPVAAHLPEYLGREYFLVDTDRPPRPDPCAGDRSAMRDRAAELEEQLSEQRLRQGVYDPGLADPEGELAGVYGDLCNHPAALRHYREALQRIRVSDGLLSRAQLPYLRAMARSSRAIGDFESAQRTMRHAFRVHGMGQGELDETALRDSLEYFRLAREVFIDPRSPGDIRLFYEAYEDNLAILEFHRESDGGLNSVPYDTLNPIATSHLQNMYLLLGTDVVAESIGSSDSATWNYVQRLQMLGLGRGEKLLEELLAHPGAQGPKEQGQLFHRLGNWQNWNNKWQRACKTYALAWQSATEAGDTELLEQLAQPSALPEDASLWDSLHDPGILIRSTVEVSFTVSARGMVSEVDAQVLDDSSSSFSGRLGRWLRDSHARPAVVDGACVEGRLEGGVFKLLR